MTGVLGQLIYLGSIFGVLSATQGFLPSLSSLRYLKHGSPTNTRTRSRLSFATLTRSPATAGTALLASSNDGGFSSSASFSQSDDDTWLFQSLRQRAKELNDKTQEIAKKWKKGDCKTTVPLVFPDWVRRLAIDYPLVACGSASETVYLGHLETGQLIAESTYSTRNDSEADDEEEASAVTMIKDTTLRQTMRFMFGNYDGGGTLSIAFEGSLLCEGGRGGGVRLWRINPTSKRLVSQGCIPALEGMLATCLHLDSHVDNINEDEDDNGGGGGDGDGHLWVGTHDGQVFVHKLNNPLLPLALQRQPYAVWNFQSWGSPVLSLQLCPNYACGVAALASGSVVLFSTKSISNRKDDGPREGIILATLYPPFDSSERRSANTYPSASTFVHMEKTMVTTLNDQSKEVGLSLVVGGSDGSLYCQSIALIKNKKGGDNSGDWEVDAQRPFQEPLQAMGQGHLGGGLIKAMASPLPNIFVTLGQDGCMKVWDLTTRKPFYHFAGYKVWAGSVWSDGRFLVSDGVDNSILMHDFAKSEEFVA